MTQQDFINKLTDRIEKNIEEYVLGDASKWGYVKMKYVRKVVRQAVKEQFEKDNIEIKHPKYVIE